jgi:FixJ family two-component response regulator
VGEALLIAEQHPTRIDLLLTDVVMPRLSGPEVAARLLKVRPDLDVLYMSGYPDDHIAPHGILDPGIAFLHKPLRPKTLLAKVREVLEAR